MRFLSAILTALAMACGHSFATTILVVPVFEPISLRGTDGDDVVSDTGDALQATVMSRPMALSGAYPEALIDAIRSPHMIPGNNPNYKVQEANLLVLCNIGVSGTLDKAQHLTVRLDVSQLAIPAEVDLTARQILKLTIVAVRRTLEEYQRQQTQPLQVNLIIEGTDQNNSTLQELATKFPVGGAPGEK